MHKEEEKRSGFWWHWQNLKKDSPKAWIHGRAWLHKQPSGTICLEWCAPASSLQIEMTIGGQDQLRFSLACWLFVLYLSFERWTWLRKWKATNAGQGRLTDLAIHHWALWWHLWAKEDEWDAKTPKWREGCLHLDDCLLGKYHFSEVKEPPIPVVLSLPEGEYPAEVIFSTRTWKRPRLPWPLVRRDAEVHIPGGIPIPGKGENSWDCEDTAYLVLGSSSSTVEGALADAITRVHETRRRYGGAGWIPAKKGA